MWALIVLAFSNYSGDPHENPEATGDAYKTLFVARVAFDTSDRRIKREFEEYGPVKKVTLVRDKEGKSRGYAFIEFEKEKDMRSTISARPLLLAFACEVLTLPSFLERFPAFSCVQAGRWQEGGRPSSAGRRGKRPHRQGLATQALWWRSWQLPRSACPGHQAF